MKCPQESYRRYRRARLAGTCVRDYALEHACYHARPAVRRKTNARHRARYMLGRLGVIAPGDHRVVHHRNGDALDNRLSNLRVITVASHRRHHRRQHLSEQQSRLLGRPQRRGR